MSRQPELWIGLVEVRPLNRKAYGALRAPLRTRILSQLPHREKYSISDEIEDMIQRAEFNTEAIVYGTFHQYLGDQ
jgi:hypothetical protein